MRHLVELHVHTVHLSGVHVLLVSLFGRPIVRSISHFLVDQFFFWSTKNLFLIFLVDQFFFTNQKPFSHVYGRPIFFFFGQPKKNWSTKKNEKQTNNWSTKRLTKSTWTPPWFLRQTSQEESKCTTTQCPTEVWYQAKVQVLVSVSEQVFLLPRGIKVFKNLKSNTDLQKVFKNLKIWQLIWFKGLFYD